MAQEPYKIEVDKEKDDVFNTTIRCYYPNFIVDERLENHRYTNLITIGEEQWQRFPFKNIASK